MSAAGPHARPSGSSSGDPAPGVRCGPALRGVALAVGESASPVGFAGSPCRAITASWPGAPSWASAGAPWAGTEASTCTTIAWRSPPASAPRRWASQDSASRTSASARRCAGVSAGCARSVASVASVASARPTGVAAETSACPPASRAWGGRATVRRQRRRLAVEPRGVLERAQQQRARLGAQAHPQQQRAVVLVVPAQRAARVLARLARRLGRLLGAPKPPHHPLHVIGRAVQRDHQQRRLGGRRGHAAERAHLRVAQLAPGHRRGDPRQRLQGVRHAHLLARRAAVDAALAGQPVRARVREPAVGPAAAMVELGHERQPAPAGRVQMPRRLGDLRPQLRQRRARHRSARLRAQ